MQCLTHPNNIIEQILTISSMQSNRGLKKKQSTADLNLKNEITEYF